MGATHKIERAPGHAADSTGEEPTTAELPLLVLATPAAVPVAGLAVGDGMLHRHAEHPDDPLGGGPVPAGTVHALRRRRSGGSPLPDDVAAQMGTAFGADLTAVRVHTDSEADRIARSLASDAFTYGTDVYFTTGKFDPRSEPGQRLLAHELTHVVQGSAGGSSGAPTIGRADDPAERHADQTAGKVVSSLRRQAVGADHHHHDHEDVCVAQAETDTGAGNAVSALRRHADQPGDQLEPAPGHTHGHDETIRRHGSPEHLLLGQIGPRDLRKIPDALALMSKFGFQATGPRGGKKQRQRKAAARQQIVEAIHLVLQERARVREWQAGPSKGRAPENADEIFDVKIVKLDNDARNGVEKPSPPVLVTYGELNTLADYFGGLNDLYAVSNDSMYKVLQTEREDYYTYLGKLFRELTADDYVLVTVPNLDAGAINTSPTKQIPYYRHEKWYDTNLDKVFSDTECYVIPEGEFFGDELKETKTEFEGTQSSIKKAGVASWVAGMHGIDTVLDADPATKKQGGGGVWGATARNACHFAPQSWYSWKGYHEKARQLAKTAFELHSRGDKKVDETAASMANEAYLTNGFGDHYLQDSFAAGHLINKTLVMQWYLQFINDNWKFFGPSEKEWQRLMMMSEENQPGLAGRELYEKNVNLKGTSPQDINPEAGGQAAFKKAGLVAPNWSTGVVNLLKWWRKEIGTNKKRQTVAKSELLKVPGVSKAAVDELLRLPFVVDKGRTWGSYVPLIGTDDRYYLLNETPDVSHEKAANDEKYNVGKTMTYNVYGEFMKNALIQSGAGDLHNYFCKFGLDVGNDAGEDVFRIYGDYVMLTGGGGAGVQISAETAEMSRQAITDILETGKTEVTTQGIFDRFPSWVAMPDKIFKEDVEPTAEPDYESAGKQMLRLDKWHDELHPLLTKIFTKGTDSLKDRVVWFGARLPTKTDLAALGVVVPHGGEEF